MKIICYKTELDQDCKNILVKESSGYYAELEKPNSPQKIVNMLNTVFHMDRMAEEYSYLIAMDTKCNVVGIFELSHGTVAASLVAPREIFVRLCLCGASNFVIAHNHPSGDPTPSIEDRKITKNVKECADIMQIPLLDHIIVGNESYYSFKERKELQEEKKDDN